jgi:hypothetical protein
VDGAAGAPRVDFGDLFGLGSGLLTVAGGWLTDSIVVVARSVQITGFGLPVAAVALSARRAVAAAASMKGARRSGRTPAVADL